MLPRSDFQCQGKLAARRGRKATDLPLWGGETAELQMHFDVQRSSVSACARFSGRVLPVFLVLIATAVLQGCGGGGGGSSTANSTAPTVGSSAPVVTGSPSTQVVAGQPYSFKPSASDANHDSLSFAIANMPAWASFNAGTGEISGTPTVADVGTFANITISVSDGTSSVSLPAFSIAVVAAGNGVATVSWTPPTTRIDGSALGVLQGYRIYYGTSASDLSTVVTVNNPGVASYVIDNLATGTYYFSVTAFDADGESNFSDTASKVIG